MAFVYNTSNPLMDRQVALPFWGELMTSDDFIPIFSYTLYSIDYQFTAVKKLLTFVFYLYPGAVIHILQKIAHSTSYLLSGYYPYLIEKELRA